MSDVIRRFLQKIPPIFAYINYFIQRFLSSKRAWIKTEEEGRKMRG
jgi:hypothetical protein